MTRAAALAAAAAVAFVMPAWSVLKRLVHAREELDLSALQATGALTTSPAEARAAAAALGFVCALVVVWPAGAGPSPVEFVARMSLGAGSLLALAAAVGFALNMLAMRRLALTDRPFVLLAWMHAVQLPMAAVLVAFGPGLALADTRTFGWAALCAAGGLCAHYSLSRASRLADAIVVAPMDFLRVPLIAAVGAAVYGEPLRLPVALGAAGILVANGLNLWAERRAARVSRA